MAQQDPSRANLANRKRTAALATSEAHNFMWTAGTHHGTFSSSSSCPFQPYEADQLRLFETGKRYRQSSTFCGFPRRSTYVRSGPCNGMVS